MNETTFLASHMPNKEIAVDRFLQDYPNYDGCGVLIAIFVSYDSASLFNYSICMFTNFGVDPAAAGLQVTLDEKPKILDVINCGDVDTSKVVKADADGCICGASGASLINNTSWKNPSGEWHIGYKFVYELFIEELTSCLKVESQS
ncbi:hypothetical protein Ahy_A01g002781 [Arachis hypogaea]|uniref:Uncharacterized protein n=1 Tax=Arachis hypogaea TaxID=3818 RepID=A0A445ERF9_ARAHY|nr:hypothetical protein Ahy_A01g002781 [Arachis hypogaea]